MVARAQTALKKSLFIMRRVFFMQEGVDDGDFNYFACSGKLKPADVFTKPIFETVAYIRAKRYFMGDGKRSKSP